MKKLLDLTIGYSSESFEMLVEYKPEQVERIIKDDKHSTFLIAAIQSGDTDLILRLLKLGANINNTNNYGNTPLHEAVLSEANIDTIKTLLESGADKEIRNDSGETAEETAKIMGYKTIANFIKGFKMPTLTKSARR
jgi:ankyrin repeat protein